MPLVIIVLVVGLFYLGIDGAHRLDTPHAGIGLTEIIIAVVAGLILYFGEFHPQLFRKRRTPPKAE